jgi:hypothetical protein
MTQDPSRILEKLAKDVEAAVHAMYRGEARQATTRVKTSHLVAEAKAALAESVPSAPSAAPRSPTPGIPKLAVSPRPSASAPVVQGAAAGWTAAQSDAVMRCVMAWLPMGAPSSTAPDTKCVAAGKMLVPTWGEREAAREAVRSLS